MDSMNLDARSFDETSLAVELFTDREDPQEAFERKLYKLSEFRTKAFGVLSFYGIGGVGKTWLKDKLIRVLKEQESTVFLNGIHAYYAQFDFGAEGISSDKLTFLTSLRNQLYEIDHNLFRFDLFDTARICYYKGYGVNGKIDADKELSVILEKNAWLKAIVSTIGAIPGGDALANVIQAIDSGVAGIIEEVNKKAYKQTINGMMTCQPNELLDNLHLYFKQDLYRIVQEEIEKPIVFFLDTYEQFVDTLNSNISKIETDHWLRRGKSSLIQGLPGVMWVIMGREHMSWREDDPFWDNTMEEIDSTIPLSDLTEEQKERLSNDPLEQHLLGDLCETDAMEYFRKAGINEAELRKHLYELTKGTPIYMDICVKHYNTLSEYKKPEKDDFGKDKSHLINRYLKNMPEKYQKLLIFLSLLGKWDDKKLHDVRTKLSYLKYYTQSDFDEMIRHSFVVMDREKKNYIHETVRTACIDYADQEVKDEIYSAIALYETDQILKKGDITEINSLIDSMVYEGADYSTSYSSWEAVVTTIKELEKPGQNKMILEVLRNLFFHVRKAFAGSGFEYIVAHNYAYWMCRNGMLRDAERIIEDYNEKELYEDIEKTDLYLSYKDRSCVLYFLGRIKGSFEWALKAYEGIQRIGAMNNEKSLVIMSNLASCYDDMGEFAKALEMKKEVLKKREDLLGPDHPDSIKAKNNLAISYESMGEYEKALEMKKEVLKKREELQGPDHPDTISAQSGLASAYENMGEYAKALEMEKEILKKREELQGPDHPDTISAKNNLAVMYEDMGEYEKALQIEQEVLKKREEILGPDHPDSINAKNNLAVTYEDLGEYEKALEMKKEVLEKREELLGPDHPDTISAKNNLAIAYGNVGEHEKALEMKREVLRKREELLGPDHPDTISAKNNLASSYDKMGEREKALELEKEVLKKREEIQGPDHPDTISAKTNLVIAYGKMREYAKALEIAKEVAEKSEIILGPEHPQTIEAKSLLKILSQ